MLKLKATSPLVRETAVLDHGRPLILELHPGFLAIHPKGTQQKVTVDYATVQAVGYKLLARQQEREGNSQ
jgi:sporulation protein YlmC with PRC-barrel domain